MIHETKLIKTLKANIQQLTKDLDFIKLQLKEKDSDIKRLSEKMKSIEVGE